MALGDDDAADRVQLAKDGIHYCEPSNPWDREKSKRAYHPHAREVDDSQEDGWPGGDTVRVRCRVCGHSWTKELPQ